MMNQPASAPMVLAEGTEFARGVRTGKVYRVAPNGCEVLWHEWLNLETGEVVRAIADFIPAEVIGREVSRGHLRILKLPETMVHGGQVPGKSVPTQVELERASHRECYILAAQQLIDDEKLQARRVDFVRHYLVILGLGTKLANKRADRTSGGSKCGTTVQNRRPPECGETIFRWWSKWAAGSRILQMDGFRNCGRKVGDRYTDEEDEFYGNVIRMRLHEERPPISSIVESVQAAVREENLRRSALPIPETVMQVPGYDWIWMMIARLAPVDHKVRTRGMAVAYRDLHTLGLGLQVTRVLERVELDEYTVDLMVFMRMLEIDTKLTPEERRALGLDGTPQRLILSAAIDVFSGAIVGLQIARAGSVEVTLRTIEMIYLDKQPIADAVGARREWPMHGQPQTLALDRSNINMSDIVYLRLSHAGITNLAVPAGKPFLKPWIEQFFRTVGSLFLTHFSGRTFSDVVRRGENDPAARATVTLDEFLKWLTRWIVDTYHTRKPDTIGRKSPLQTWTEAVASSPPLVRTDQKMLRKAFGSLHSRKVCRDGVTVEGLRYYHEEIARWFLSETERDLEVVWWDKKIGAIEVGLPDGRWVTAECVDPKWADASYDDLIRQRLADKEAALFGQADRDRAIVDLDIEMNKKAALRGLIPVPPSAEELEKRTREFSRYMASPDRTPDVYGDVFDNEVPPFIPDQPASAPVPTPHASHDPASTDTGDIME
ncbi:hypothetical protein [Rhodobacter sp. CZR27]|uniref:hypothetical protein n=1 Tax=Rhodobacter sp. CZR27 TaxID=2033869 RepID=UPI0012FD8B7A|nr:hypothetical protein [Rhodobacter sp. CZR27]